MSKPDELMTALFRQMADTLRETTYATLLDGIATQPAPARDLLTDLLTAKRTLDAMPPVLQAVKCHPADVDLFRRANAPALNKTIFGAFGSVAVFRDVRMQRGQFLPAYDRATVDAWILEEWRNHLLSVLRWRASALQGVMHG